MTFEATPDRYDTADTRLRVVIADDHRLVGGAVASILEETGRFRVTMTDCLSGLMAEIAARGEADVVLLDLKMPGMAGLPSVIDVVRRNASGRVILFSGNADNHFVQSALENGIAGYIPKTMPLQSLVTAIDLVMSGQVFVPVDQRRRIFDTGNAEVDALTSVELTVLRQAADGATNKEIARDIDATEVTVKMHMRIICRKLGAKNRTHAAMLARERMLI